MIHFFQVIVYLKLNNTYFLKPTCTVILLFQPAVNYSIQSQGRGGSSVECIVFYIYLPVVPSLDPSQEGLRPFPPPPLPPYIPLSPHPFTFHGVFGPPPVMLSLFCCCCCCCCLVLARGSGGAAIAL